MTGLWILLAAVGALALIALLMGLARVLLGRDRRLADTAITNLRDFSSVDERTGAIRSVQTADLQLSERALEELWSPANLERLARTYWRFLARATLGLVRVRYTDDERLVVLVCRPLTLLAFRAPEYEVQADHGVVRWRIERGLLVAPAGGERRGHLQIDVRRLQATHATGARVHIEIEVANFHPAIASRISRRLYNATQSRIHVIVTHGFLRSLARLDLARSHVGRLAPNGEAGDPAVAAAQGPAPEEAQGLAAADLQSPAAAPPREGAAEDATRTARPRTAPAASRDRGAR
jgi:hypothetical protein